MAPTLIEGPARRRSRPRSCSGRSRTLHRVRGFEEALALANDLALRPDGGDLDGARCTAARSSWPAMASGVASVNGPTYGSEPHMPFGGLRDSGTGWREAGTEAIDVYSDWKVVNLVTDPALA